MKPTDLQAAAEAGAKAAAALLPPRPTDRGAVQAFGTRMTSYLKRRKSRRAATPAPEPTSQLTKMLLEYEARLNAFCPTGEGGGVDPTCSPRGRTGSGETVVVFHGTAESALASIAEHGLVPKAGKGGDHHALIGGQNYAVTYADVAGRDVSVFVSTDAAKASVFAAKAASVNKSQPVILRLEIPRHLLKEDEAGGSASFHRFEGTIKPEHIKEVLGIDYDRDDFVSRGPLRRPVGNAAAAFLIFFTDGPALNAFCPTGKGGGVDPTCSPSEKLARLPEAGPNYFATMGLVRAWLRTPVANSPPPRKALADALYDISSEYTRAQAREVARTVREGYDNDKGVEKVAAELKRRLGLEDAQANVLAQTEMTRVAALDQLDQTARAGLDEVMFISHENACPQCEALHGKTFPLKKAHDVLPVHPNCTCRFQPVGSTHNVFCPTGEGGGIDPTCSPKNKHSALSLSSEVAAVKSAARLSQKHLIFGSFTKTHPETRKQVISVLERLADQYGMPPGGIHIVEMSGGSTNHRASMGEKTWVRVSKEESARLKAEGLKTQLVPGSKGGFVHQVEDPTALRLSLYTNGTKDQAGFNQDPGQYTSIRNRKGNNVNTGRSGIEDTIVHEFGHALAFRAVGPEGVKRLGEEKADAELARSVSRYAATDKSELMAEAFVKYDAGSRDDRLVDLLRPYLPSAEK